MTFSYSFEKADWMALHAYHMRHSRMNRQVRFWSRFSFVPIPLAIHILGYGNPSITLGLAPLFWIVAVLWFFLQPTMSDDAMRKRMRKIVEDPENARMFGRRTMTLGAESVHISEPGLESTIAPGRIVKVVGTPEHLFVYISALEAIVISRSSLAGASFEEVEAALERLSGQPVLAG